MHSRVECGKSAALGATAAAAGAFSLAHQVDAAVVYSGLQNLTLSWANNVVSANASLGVNLDGQAGNDVTFLGHFIATTLFQSGFARAINSAGGGLKTNGNATFGLKKLAFGAAISGTASFSAGGNFKWFQNGAPYAGTWPVNSVGYLGVKFQNGANTHYGWIRAKWEDAVAASPYPDKITVIDWAYNNTPGAGITAGEGGGPIPEPSRALLALAGAGAAFLRRRRKAHW